MKRYSLLVIFIGLFVSNSFICKNNSFFCSLYKRKTEEKKEKKVKPFDIDVSGYVKLDSFFDTRQIVGQKAGIFFQFPANELLDVTGVDSNDQPQFNQGATESLVHLDITGPKVGEANSFAVIETDFIVGSGSLLDSTIGAVQLRHAYMNFDWTKTTIMLGHSVHPLSPAILLPNRISYNYEGVYAPRVYVPQARLYRSSNKFDMLFAICSHYKNQSSKQAIIPNLYFQCNRKFDQDVAIGAGIDFRAEKPRLVTLNNYKTSKSINSIVAHCFGIFYTDYSAIKLRFAYAENAQQYDMLGGFGIINVDAVTEERTYANLRSLNVTTEIMRETSNYEIGFFLGFAKNIGAKLSSSETILTTAAATVPTGLGTTFDTTDNTTKLSTIGDLR